MRYARDENPTGQSYPKAVTTARGKRVLARQGVEDDLTVAELNAAGRRSIAKWTVGTLAAGAAIVALGAHPSTEKDVDSTSGTPQATPASVERMKQQNKLNGQTVTLPAPSEQSAAPTPATHDAPKTGDAHVVYTEPAGKIIYDTGPHGSLRG